MSVSMKQSVKQSMEKCVPNRHDAHLFCGLQLGTMIEREVLHWKKRESLETQKCPLPVTQSSQNHVRS